MPRNFLLRFRSDIERFGRGAKCVIATEGRYQLQYVPFEHVNRNSRIVLVGITPGTTQISLSYDALRDAFMAGLDENGALAAAKAAGAFGGSMRNRLNQMFERFRIHHIASVSTPDDFWKPELEILHCTSVIPHAGFKNERMFNGSFSEILTTPLLRASFECDFLPTLPLLPADARFIAVGRTPSDAITWCVDNGYLRRDQVLGAFPHPSGNAGSQVDYFTGKKKAGDLVSNDPVRHRLPWLDRIRAELERSVAECAVYAATADAEQTDPSVHKVRSPFERARATTRMGDTVPGCDLRAVVKRGKAAGTILYPHVHEDGCYVVSPDRYEANYIRVETIEDVKSQIRRGLSLRMSNQNKVSHRAPSLISPASIIGWR